MSRTDIHHEPLLSGVAAAVRGICPEARIVLYGSHARGDAHPDSDWDLLIVVDDAHASLDDRIRRAVYDIELDSGEVLSLCIRTHSEWEDPLNAQSQFGRSVAKEGIVL